MAAAVSGLGLRDLAVLAGETLARCWQPGRQDLPQPGPGSDPDGQPGGEPGGKRDPTGQPGDGRPDREPGGLASFLRRQQLGARFSGPSLPLDIGCADTVPASIRNAVRLRNRHCQWVGGYFL